MSCSTVICSAVKTCQSTLRQAIKFSSTRENSSMTYQLRLVYATQYR